MGTRRALPTNRCKMVFRNVMDPEDPYSSSNSEDDPNNLMSMALLSTSHDMYLFNTAASGDAEGLKKILNVDGLTSDVIGSTVSRVLSKDVSRKERNILHMAAGFLGHPSAAHECVLVILEFAKKYILNTEYGTFVNALDNDAATPLYLAAKYENMEASRVLLDNGSDFDLPTIRGKTPIMKLFKKMPSVLGDMFNEKGKRSFFIDGDRQEVSLYLRTFISIPMASDVEQKSPGLYREMDLLSNLSFTPFKERERILENTHVKALVWLKWQNYRWLFWLARGFQASWFLLYITYLLSLYRFRCPFPGGRVYNFSWIVTNPSSAYFNYTNDELPLFSERNCATTRLRIIGWILMASAFLDGVLIEGYPIVVRFHRKWYPIKTHSFRKYIKQVVIIVRILHVEKLAFLISIFLNTVPINFNQDIVNVQFQYIFAAIGIFLSCYQLFLQLGKFPQLKGYVKMFRNTLLTLTLVIVLYGTMIFAFAMAFCILLPGEVTYSSPFEAILRVFTFTIGEVDFEDTFYGEDASPPASFVMTTLFFGVAIIVLHIALLNYLIGLTINELENVWKKANLWKTYTYLWQIYLCETFISHFPFPYFKTFLYNRMVLQCKYETVTSLAKDSRIRFHEIRMDKLPKYIREEIRKLNLKWIPRKMGGSRK